RCRLKAASTVCRSATSECDLPEYCTGHSEFCPKDVYKMNGLPCASDQAFCIQGSCTTHTDQCRLLWGATGRNSDAECYQQNTRANRYANCGYTRATETKDAQYLRCDSEDVLCGRLHCKHLNERLEYGLETAAKLTAAFININGTIEVCRAAVIDLGTQDVDPGMVPDGAKCGDDKVQIAETGDFPILRPQNPDCVRLWTNWRPPV
ncbi:jg26237, partial [Pararge aegeria aegeria]